MRLVAGKPNWKTRLAIWSPRLGWLLFGIGVAFWPTSQARRFLWRAYDVAGGEFAGYRSGVWIDTK